MGSLDFPIRPICECLNCGRNRRTCELYTDPIKPFLQWGDSVKHPQSAGDCLHTPVSDNHNWSTCQSTRVYAEFFIDLPSFRTPSHSPSDHPHQNQNQYQILIIPITAYVQALSETHTHALTLPDSFVSLLLNFTHIFPSFCTLLWFFCTFS